jgi:hypothetical protein
MMLFQAALAVAATLLAYTTFARSGIRVSPEDEKPNILFIFTDDQDKILNSLDYMYVLFCASKYVSMPIVLTTGPS